eukprot:2045869-Amphidinium_carterae.1
MQFTQDVDMNIVHPLYDFTATSDLWCRRDRHLQPVEAQSSSSCTSSLKCNASIFPPPQRLHPRRPDNTWTPQ